MAKDLLPFYWAPVVADGRIEQPKEKVAREGLGLLGEKELAPLVAAVIGAQPQAVADYRAGKVALLEFLVGQAMKETRGRADAALVRELFRAALA